MEVIIKKSLFLSATLLLVITACASNTKADIRPEMKVDATIVRSEVNRMMRSGEIDTKYNGAIKFSDKYQDIEKTDDEHKVFILLNQLVISMMQHEKGVLLKDDEEKEKALNRFNDVNDSLSSLLGK